MDYSQKRKLAGAAVIVMSSIILSRITGFLRVVLVPSKIGVNATGDAYNIAFLVPDLMFNLLVGGAVAAALIPVMSGYIEKKQEDEGWKAVGTFINVILVSILFFCILGVIFTPQIVPVIAPGFMTKPIETQLLAIRITRILFPSVAFLMLAGLCNGILNSYQRFAAAAYGPSIYNLGSAASIFIFGSNKGDDVERVAYGVACSAFLYFLFQFAFTFKHLKFYKLKFFMNHSGFRSLFKLAIPSLLASSIVQINVIVSSAFVTLFKSGSIVAFKMADNVWQLPYGVFAQGIGIAMLPTLSAKLAIGETENFKSILNKGMRAVLLPAIPSAIGFVMLKEPIVNAIYNWNNSLKTDEVQTTANILMFFSIALITQSIVAIMNRAFYANNDTKTPLFIGIGTILLNYGISYILLKTTTLEASGMALSYSIISTFNAVFLLSFLKKRIKGIDYRELLSFSLKVFLASCIMGVVLYFIQMIPVALNTKAIQLLYLTFEIIAGGLVFFAATMALKVEEVAYVVEKGTNRLKTLLKR